MADSEVLLNNFSGAHEMSEKKENNLKRVKELVDLMKANDLVELEIADGDNKIHLKRPHTAGPTVTHVPIAHVAPMTASVPVEAAGPTDTQPEGDGLTEIPSPMVGTFYSAPSPESKPFVAIGDMIWPDTVVCVVEAMKVMNEIKAETSGTISKILCKAGEAVEFGQALFLVRPD